MAKRKNTKTKGLAATANPDTKTTKANFNDTSAQNQRNIVLTALRESPKTTIELRHDFGIMQPAPRIFELKKRGFNILSLRVATFTPDGIKHSKVAKYILRGESHE